MNALKEESSSGIQAKRSFLEALKSPVKVMQHGVTQLSIQSVNVSLFVFTWGLYGASAIQILGIIILK